MSPTVSSRYGAGSIRRSDAAGESSSLQLAELSLVGSSRAGQSTWFRVQPPGLALDVGRGNPRLAGAGDLFLTHGHLDHSLGLPYVLSQRVLQGLGPTRVFCPAPIEGAVAGWIAAGERLEGKRYEYELEGLEPGDRVSVGPALWIEAFATDHGVPSLGYLLVRGRRRLAAQFAELPAAELVELRGRGVDFEERWEEDWLCYCGDTGAETLDREGRLYRSRVLLLECTFLAAADRERGERYGHLHLEDIASRAERFENDAVILHHLSRRHRVEELAGEVRRHLGALAERVHVWPEG